jgi:DNA-binding transcriptional LysR family regulator
MEIRQLHYFVEICRCKSFSKAAEACFISSQGISMSMMRLENELGYKLFHRYPRGIELTPQAEFLLPRAKKILALVDECARRFDAISNDTYLLSVGFSLGTIEEFAGDVIPHFIQDNPGVKLDIREYPDQGCDEAVLNQEIEVGLTVGPIDENAFDGALLFSSRHAILVRKDHALAQKKSLTAADLRDLPIAVLKGETRTYPCLRQACHAAGFEPNISAFADNILLVFYMAESMDTAGLSTLPLFHRLNRPNLAAIPLEDPIFDWNIYMIRRKGAVLSPPANRFWKAVLKHRDEMRP